MGLPGVDGATALMLAEDAIQHLEGTHSWIPAGRADETLREPLDHGGFVGQAALFAELDRLAAVDRLRILSGHLLDGLAAIAEQAPLHAQTAVSVHADCHWGNWLAYDGSVTALLDFEWARFSEPVDDSVTFSLTEMSQRPRETSLVVVLRRGANRSSADGNTTVHATFGPARARS
jgi:hypothetical protein